MSRRSSGSGSRRGSDFRRREIAGQRELRAGDLKLNCLPSDRKIELTVDEPRSSSPSRNYHLDDGRKDITLHWNNCGESPAKDAKFDPRPYKALQHCLTSPKNMGLNLQKISDTPGEKVLGPVGGMTEEEDVIFSGMSILSNYPLGVHLRVLEKEMNKCNIQTRKFLEKYPGLFQIVYTSRDRPLVFLRSPLEIKSIWKVVEKLFHYFHLLLILDPHHGIPLKDLPTRLQNVFGIRFSPESWGYEESHGFFQEFSHVNDYGEFYYSSSPIPGIYLKADEVIGDLPEKDQGYFPLKGVYDLQWEYLSSYYTDFVRGGVLAIPRIDEGLLLRKQYLVVGESLRSPEHFRVSLWQYKWTLEAFMQMMTKTYERWSRDPLVKERIRTRSDQLTVGAYYVAIKWGREEEEEQDKEWHRAEIIRRDRTNRFDVFLVDKAICLTRIPAERLMALHRAFMEFPVQTFLCTLKPTSGLREVIKEGRRGVAMRMFLNLLRKKIFVVSPIKRTCRDKLMVQTLIIDDVKTLNVLIPDLAKDLIRHHRQIDLGWDKENWMAGYPQELDDF